MAVTFTDQSSRTANLATSTSTSFTLTAANALAVIMAFDRAVSGVTATWNGVESLTAVAPVHGPDVNGYYWYTFALLNPTNGTNTIAFSWTTSARMFAAYAGFAGALSFKNATFNDTLANSNPSTLTVSSAVGDVVFSMHFENTFTSASPVDNFDLASSAGNFLTLGSVDRGAKTAAAGSTLTSVTWDTNVSWSAAGFNVSATAASQTLTPSVFTDADVFFSPRMDRAILPALFVDAETFFTPAIRLQNQTLAQAAKFTDNDTFFAPTIFNLLQFLTPAKYTDADVFFAPTIANLNRTVPQAATFVDADAFYAPLIVRHRLLPDTFPAATGAATSPLTRLLVTVQGHDGDEVQTLRFATDGFTSIEGVAPAYEFIGRIIDPGNFERHMFGPGTTRGRSSVGAGDVVLASGEEFGGGDTLDYLLDWGFDGRLITIKLLEDDSDDTADAILLLVATIEQLFSDNAYTRIAFKLHDKLADLAKPLLLDSFLGTTTAGGLGTAEGNENLTGQKKQQCFGTVFEAPAQVANAFDLVYLFNNGPCESITVYDGGLELTNAGDDTTLAALLAWVQVAGQVRTCHTLGYARLGILPVGTVTATVVEGGDPPVDQVGSTSGNSFYSFGSVDWTLYGTSRTGASAPWTLTEGNTNVTHGAQFIHVNPGSTRYRFVGEFARGSGTRNLTIYVANPGFASYIAVIVDLGAHTITFAQPLGAGAMLLHSYSAIALTATNITRVIFEFTTDSNTAGNVTWFFQFRTTAGLESYLGDATSSILVYTPRLMPTVAPALDCSAGQIVQRMIIQRTNFDLAMIDDTNLLPTDFTTWSSQGATLRSGSPAAGLYQLVESATTDSHYGFKLIAKDARPITYRFTADFQAVGSREIYLYSQDTFGTGGIGISFNLTTGAENFRFTFGGFTLVDASATDAGGGFWTLDVAIGTNSDTGLSVFLVALPPALTQVYAGDGASGYLVRNINLAAVTPLDFDSIDLLDRKTSSVPCGIHVTGDVNVIDAAQAVLDSVGGYLLADRNGIFTVGRMDEPPSIPASTAEILPAGQPWNLANSTLTQSVNSPDVASPDLGGIWVMKESLDGSLTEHGIYVFYDKPEDHILYEFSAEFKANGRNVIIYIADNNYLGYVELWLDLTAGEFLFTHGSQLFVPHVPLDVFALDDWTITDMGGGYWRVTVSVISSHENSIQVFLESFLTTATVAQITTASGSAARVYTGDGASGFFIRNWSFRAVDPSVLVIDESMIIGDVLQRQATGDSGNGVPNWKTTTRYAKNYTVQDGTQVFEAVSNDRKTFLANEWRSTAPIEDTAVHDVHLLAGELAADTLLTNATDATYENTRLHHLHASTRSAYVVEVDLTLTFDAEIGTVVTLKTDQTQRFGLGDGANFRVIGRVEHFEKKTADLVLWR